MIGFILSFEHISNEAEAQYERLKTYDKPIYGVVFPDGQCYLHEPIVDTFGSMQDMTDRLPGCNVEFVGPVMPTQMARKTVEETYKRSMEDQAKGHKAILKMLSDCDEYAGKFFC